MNLFNYPGKDEPRNDERLLARYRETGDLAILGELFQSHSRMVYYVCFRYLQDSELSKDAVMQIFEELIGKIRKQDIREFSKWLYVVTKNHCLMQLRAGKKMTTVSIDEFVEFPGDPHPEGEPSNEDRLGVMEACMEKLPKEQKQAIRHFFLEERCYKDVADLTGYSLNEVKSYIQNGKRNLKNCMEKNSERD